MSSVSISIITATFNAGNVLPGLIQSLREQTDKNFEWVVVDGESTDTTVEIIKSAGDVISQWISEPDFGIYDAINKAIKKANGDYYLVCGADDRLSPTAIADYRRAALESSAHIISASVESESEIFRPMQGRAWLRGQSAFVSHHSVGTLIKKSLHDDFGYYSARFPITADHYFLKRVCTAPGNILMAADFIAGHYSNTGLSDADIPGTMAEFFRVQLETERFHLLQLLLYGMRLIRHSRRIIKYAIGKRAANK